MLLNWIKKNRSLALKITGANFLLVTIIMLFWSQPKAIMGENAKSAASVARMEARAERKSPASSSSSITRAYKKNQEKQLRVMLIIMALLGTGFLVYGFIDKPKEK